MVTTSTALQVQRQSWSSAVLSNGVEFPLTPLQVLSGRLPTGLRGSLYRNGPAAFERSQERVGHWFDGDGAILGVHFDNEGATGVYRYVNTIAHQEELAQDRLLYGGYGTLPRGPLLQKIGRHVKNVANTSVFAFSDEVLALWEVDCPHSLDARTLQTQGMTKLGKRYRFPYSAHPKQDPKTKEIFNFGVSYRVTHATINLYRSDASGQIQQHRKYRMPKIGYVHDIALVGRYLVLIMPPIRVQTVPHLALLQRPVSECMTWHPEEGTEIWVFDRETLERVDRIKTDPWFHWHFGNGYETEDGRLVMSVVRYADFHTNQSMRELVKGEIKTPSPSALWELQLGLNPGRVIDFSPLWNRTCEMPTVPLESVGYQNRYTFVSCYRRQYVLGDWFKAIARYDHQTGQVVEADFGEFCYPSEPIYASDLENPEKAWIITVVYDSAADQSEVWIFDADCLNAEPVCRLGLPEVIPLSFHGTWRSQ